MINKRIRKKNLNLTPDMAKISEFLNSCYLEYLDPVDAFSVKMGHTTINAEQQSEA